MKKSKVKSEQISRLNSKEHLDLSTTNRHLNLPEFIHFQLDHLRLTPKLISHPFYDRSRSLSAFQLSKYNRPSIASQTTTRTNPTLYSPIKRISRSRHSYDSVAYHEKQQQKYPPRSKMKKFDSMSCFNEVSRLEISFFSSCSLKHMTSIA